MKAQVGQIDSKFKKLLFLWSQILHRPNNEQTNSNYRSKQAKSEQMVVRSRTQYLVSNEKYGTLFIYSRYHSWMCLRLLLCSNWLSLFSLFFFLELSQGHCSLQHNISRSFCLLLVLWKLIHTPAFFFRTTSKLFQKSSCGVSI